MGIATQHTVPRVPLPCVFPVLGLTCTGRCFDSVRHSPPVVSALVGRCCSLPQLLCMPVLLQPGQPSLSPDPVHTTADEFCSLAWSGHPLSHGSCTPQWILQPSREIPQVSLLGLLAFPDLTHASGGCSRVWLGVPSTPAPTCAGGRCSLALLSHLPAPALMSVRWASVQ